MDHYTTDRQYPKANRCALPATQRSTKSGLSINFTNDREIRDGKPGTVAYFQVHDGWNRLAKVERGGSDDDRRINQYNGLKKKTSSDSIPDS